MTFKCVQVAASLRILKSLKIILQFSQKSDKLEELEPEEMKKEIAKHMLVKMERGGL